MIERSERTPTARKAMTETDVAALATRALSVLSRKTEDLPPSLDARIKAVCDAFIAAEDTERQDIIDRMRAEGLRSEDIISHVIPAIARRMGEMWAADEISFVHVTIGTARLQETVRALSVRNRTVNTASGRRAILLVLPKTEDHSLGAFIAAEQFRRFGYFVEIAVDQSPRQIAELARRKRFAMIGLTASGRKTLASAREFVDILRGTATHVSPIVIGGSVLDTGLDVRAMTGADHVARDARTALEKCGLSTAETGTSPIVTADHVD
jgi:methanogenic corrinoid protein MtbC1